MRYVTVAAIESIMWVYKKLNPSTLKTEFLEPYMRRMYVNLDSAKMLPRVNKLPFLKAPQIESAWVPHILRRFLKGYIAKVKKR